MIDLNPHVSPENQKLLGSLTMSDRAAADLSAAVHPGGAPAGGALDFTPVLAQSVTRFLSSVYFRDSAWFRKQDVHCALAFTMQFPGAPEPICPVTHVIKTIHGYQIVACEEVPLPEHYYEERVIEETKVEIGIPT